MGNSMVGGTPKTRVVFLRGEWSHSMSGDGINGAPDGFNETQALPKLLAEGWSVKSIQLAATIEDHRPVGYAILEKL